MTIFPDKDAIARHLVNPERFGPEHKPNPFFKFFARESFETVRDWIETLEDPIQLEPKVELGPSYFESTTNGKKSKSLFLILDGLLLQFTNTFEHQLSLQKEKAPKVTLKKARIDGKLRFPGDIIGEFDMFQKPPLKAGPTGISHEALQATTLLKIPYSTFDPSDPFSMSYRDNLAHSIVSKSRRDELHRSRHYGFSGEKLLVALLLDLMSQFGEPAFTLSDIDQFELSGCRRLLMSLVVIPIALNNRTLACMTSKLRGTIAQEVKQLSRDWGVILESGTRLPEFTELSLEGLGLPSENVAKKRALLASLGHKRYYKLSGSGPNTKIIARTCLVNLQRFIPLPLHPLLLDPHLSTTYEHEEEFRSGCLEVIHMSRLSGCRPARYNRQARSDDDRQFQNVLAYWLARNGAIDPKRPIKLPGRLKECASQNRSFHVRVV